MRTFAGMITPMLQSHDMAEDADLLRGRGLRATPQRLYVLAALRIHQGHIAAEMIAQQVRQELPSMNLATVYRALHDLREAGLIAETDLGEKSVLYELIQDRHHHIVCEQCGHVAEIDDDLLEPLK